MLTKNKLNSGIRERLLKQQEESASSGRNDPVYLPYYDLEIGQQMEILLLADDNGELYYEYSTHSAKRIGTKSIRCSYESSRESCAPCQYGYAIYQEKGKGTASDEWRKKNHALAQCIVLKSPIDIPEAEDGNMVKLFHVPFSVLETIKDGMINGTVSDPTSRVLVLKKTKKGGNSDYASYEKSFFKAEEVVIPPEFSEAYEAGMIVARDIKSYIPAATTEAEMKDWLQAALAAGPFVFRGNAGGDAAAEVAGDAPTETATHTQHSAAPAAPVATVAAAPTIPVKSLQERLAARRAGN